MPLQVVAVDADTDFDNLIACQWDAFENPLQGVFRLTCPIFGTGPSARADSLRDTTARQLAWYKADPTAFWQKAIDDDGRIVGGVLWKVYNSNPFAASAGRPVMTWYPEGPVRDYAGTILQRLDAPRTAKARRAHVCKSTLQDEANCKVILTKTTDLNIMFTHPDYRKQGVGELLLKWGIEKADELGVDIWLNSSELGLKLYRKHGFVVLEEIDSNVPLSENPSQEESELHERFKVGPAWLAWRPVGGKYIEGETIKPWE